MVPFEQLPEMGNPPTPLSPPTDDDQGRRRKRRRRRARPASSPTQEATSGAEAAARGARIPVHARLGPPVDTLEHAPVSPRAASDDGAGIDSLLASPMVGVVSSLAPEEAGHIECPGSREDGHDEGLVIDDSTSQIDASEVAQSPSCNATPGRVSNFATAAAISREAPYSSLVGPISGALLPDGLDMEPSIEPMQLTLD